MSFDKIVSGVQLAVLGVVVYYAYKYFHTGGELDRQATEGGAIQSQIEAGSWVEYDKAIDAYARSLGQTRETVQGFPTYEQWFSYNAGPVGYRYGDSNFPKPPALNTLQSVTNYFADLTQGW